MELSKKYALKIYEKKSFSAAAKSLFVSQPALSLAVGRLEEEIGFKIFDRTTSPLSLTPEGSIYIEYLYEEEARESEMRARIRELSDLSYGTLFVGASCYTAYHILPGAVTELSKLHPRIAVRVDMGNEADENILYDRLERGELDLILKYDYDPKRHKATPIISEHLGIAMPLSMVHNGIAEYALTEKELLSSDYPEQKSFSDPKIFSEVRFLPMGEHSHSISILRSMLGEIKHSPYSILGARHTAMHYNFMREGLGAAFISDFHALTSNLSDDSIRYFMPKERVKRTLYALQKKNAPYDPTAEAFISVLSEYCKSLGGKKPTEA